MKLFSANLSKFSPNKKFFYSKPSNIKIIKAIIFSLLILFILLISFISFYSKASDANTSKAVEEKHYDYFTDSVNLPYYFQLNAGLSYPKNPEGDFKGSFNRANVYEFEIGYKLGEDFRLGLNLGYRNNLKTKYTTTSVHAHDELMTSNYNYRGSSYSGMLNLSYDITTISSLTPYVNVGAGMSHNIIKGGVVETIGEADSDTYAYPAGKKNNFAYKAGLGTRVAISDSGYINLCYQFVDLGKITSGRVRGLPGGGSENAISKTGNLRSHEVLLGVGYKF
jgi:opacity protein-like surface antigen